MWLRSPGPWHRIRLALPFALLGVAVLVLPIPIPQNPATRRITINARQFEYMPGRIKVNQGDEIVLAIAATDVVHGFYLDGYGIDRRIEPGLTEQITFVADQPGKFRYRCSVSCGSLHPFMIGEFIVGPNVPFWRAAGLLLVALTGLMTFLWQSVPANSEGKMTYGATQEE